jgi:hypothetical protein
MTDEAAEPMYVRMLLEVVFPTAEVDDCRLDIDDHLPDMLGGNYVAHRIIWADAITEDHCETLLREHYRDDAPKESAHATGQ